MGWFKDNPAVWDDLGRISDRDNSAKKPKCLRRPQSKEMGLVRLPG